MNPTYERRSLTHPVEFRSSSDESHIIAFGYAAKFGKRSQNLGGFVEQIHPSAFNKTVKESDVRALLNHDPNLLLGRTSAGTLTLTIDTEGLAYEVTLPNTTAGRDTAELLARGDITGSSFGFRAIEESWGETEDGFPLRTLDSVALRDVGPVTYPAYTDSEVALRHLAESRSLDLKSLIEAAAQNDLRSVLNPSAVEEDGSDSDTTEESDDRAEPIVRPRFRAAGIR